MTTVSGTFTGVALSSTLVTNDVPQLITWSLSGTWTTPGAGISLQREKSPGGGAWETIKGPFTADANGTLQANPNERFRFSSGLTAGSVDYSVADGDVTVQDFQDRAGNSILKLKESGVEITADLTVGDDLDVTDDLRTGAGLIQANLMYGEATPLDQSFFVACRAYRVKAIIGRPLVVGSDGGAVTAVVKKVASGTAIASGTALHSSTFDMKGTINTNQSLTLSTTAADLEIAAGDAIGIDTTGTMTAARGVISVLLAPRY